MFAAFMSLHILLCGEVCPYFILRVEVFRSLNLNSNQKNLNLYKREFKVNPANSFNPTQVKGFALLELNPAYPAKPGLTRFPNPALNPTSKPAYPTIRLPDLTLGKDFALTLANPIENQISYRNRNQFCPPFRFLPNLHEIESDLN
jgi:hypothetical protein